MTDTTPNSSYPARRAAQFRSAVTVRWGRSALNRLADRAGRHRRIALGSAMLAGPIVVQSIAVIGRSEFRAFGALHLLVAGSLLWLARDLLHYASLIDGRSRPRLSLVTLFFSLPVLGLARPDAFVQQYGSVPVLVGGLALFGVAVVGLTVAEMIDEPLIGLGGRLGLVVGGLAVGLAEFVRMFDGLHGGPIFVVYSVNLGLIGAAMFGMSVFEGRLLWRALALASGGRTGR